MSGDTTETDVQLLEAVRGGDMAAYGTLHARHAAAAWALARQMVQGDLVEDLVTETFNRVLAAIRRGEGPVSAFRIYLLTAMRRYVALGEPGVEDDPGALLIDPEVAGLEESLVAQAYLSLPERWRMILWHAEVEGARAADLAPLFALSPHGVGVLAYRAREGFRQAYIHLHLAEEPAAGCRPLLAKIPPYVRGVLPKAEVRLVDEHVAGCLDCRMVLLETTDVNEGMRVIVGPLILGRYLAGYLSELGAKGAARPRGLRGAFRAFRVLGVTRIFRMIWLFLLTALLGVARAAGAVAAKARRLPTPYRAVMAGALSATIATALFLVVAYPVAEEKPLLPPFADRFRTPTLDPAGDTKIPPVPPEESPQFFSNSPSGRPMPPTPVRPTSPLPVPPATSSASPTGQELAPPIAVPPPAAPPPIWAAPPFPVPRGPGERPHPVRERQRGARRAQPPAVRRGPDRRAEQGARGTGQARDARRGTDQADQTAGRAEAEPRKERAAAEPRQERAAPASAPRLVAAVEPVGALVRGRAGIVAVRLRNTGGSASGPVDAAVAFPRGVSGLWIAGAAGGWSCRVEGTGMRCGHAPLAAKQAATVFLRVAVAADAPEGKAVTLRIKAGGQSASARSAAGARAVGASARYAAEGRLAAEVTGGPLPGRAGTAIQLPSGAGVLWAGLYWSGRAEPRTEIRMRPPGLPGYVTVRAGEVTPCAVPGGTGYRAFADVTDLVRASGRSGLWSAELPPGGSRAKAGWSLVVLVTDPKRPYGTAAVLDAATVIGGGQGSLKVPLDGMSTTAARARVDYVLWDAQIRPMISNDRLSEGTTADSRPLRPMVDRDSTLHLGTRGDVVFFGVLAVCVPTKT